ncbi:MAG: OB-fold domain-containing protein [Caulobacteraceae bacterium]|nr:OB-fold domain-containing protein [Caulobacteraceae bacterium]
MTEATAAERRTVLPCIKIDERGQAYVEARRCSACEAVVTSQPVACPSCGARNTLRPFRASERGVLHSYSIVFRSFPGVETPFISAIVDLDDGVTLKGVVRGVEPKPEAIKFGMPLRMAFDDALGRRDREGRSYVSYFFEPA